MKRATIGIIQLCLIIGIVSVHECKTLPADDQQYEDAIKFISDESSHEWEPWAQPTRADEDSDKEAMPDILYRTIINPPARPPCKRCYKLDSIGKCRKIIDCVP